MTVPGNVNELLLRTAAAAGGYTIERSVRLNSADSAYFSRTPASAGNRKTWTWSGWVKRSALSGVRQGIFGSIASDASAYLYLEFDASEQITVYDSNAGGAARTTSAVYRDVSSWYHILLAYDTTQSTANNRIRLYVNGVEVTTFSVTANPTQNSDGRVNTATAHSIGSYQPYTVPYYFSGYLADIYFIDGTALTPSSFGEFDATTGVWVPKTPTGLTYGTNGFHLDFADNSSAAALGYDAAGSNDWTVNNLSVTAGSGNDSLRDSPTNGTASTGGDAGGVTVGNYCTLNPLITVTGTLSNGNLDFSSGAQYRSAFSTFAVTTGKWYFEGTVTNFVADALIGVAYDTLPSSSYVGSNATSWAYEAATPAVFNNGAGTSFGNTYTTNDIIGVAFDADTGKLWFAKNGTWQGSGNPGGGTNPAVTVTTGKTYFFGVSGGNGGAWSTNWGARAFAYAAPSGFKALCTANLPAPTIVKPNTVMDVVLYTGTGSALTPTSTLGFNPDLVWIKGRSGATDHAWYDSVRGVEKRLESNNTDAEVTSDSGVTAFNSAGFSVGTLAQVNTNTATYASWLWDAGTSNATNTSGTITSTVRANISAGFSVLTYTGTGSNATVGHGLGVAPEMVIVKCRSNANDWAVYHKYNTAAPETDYLLLNSTAATADDNTYWNDTAPTSSLFSIGTNTDVNTSAYTYVAYCWAPVAGYSAFGSYTGNGNANGPFVYTGFRPAYVLIKGSTSITSWNIVDNKRLGYNADNYRLFAEGSSAENATGILDFTSNGFKIRNTGGDYNDNAQTYVYAAFAESPFQYARAR
jgi:hypothetical protein